MNINIAIDGPSGSGKSTAAKNLADRLRIEYIDTGAMYRAAALKAIETGTEPEDEAIGDMLEGTDIDFSGGRVFLDGSDAEDRIRNLKVSAMASKIAALPSCRKKLVEIQKGIASKKSVVMDGRDIGTNVMPQAKYKFFLTCSIEKRAERRFAELRAKGENVRLEDIAADLKKRDESDTNRELNPLVKAEDATEISTDNIGIDEVTELLMSYIENAGV